jgi:hypothetical protein
MTRAPRPAVFANPNPHPPLVVHAQAESRLNRQTGQWDARHPCGAAYVRGVTVQPRTSNWNYATGTWLPSLHVNCAGCIAELERHAAACRAARAFYGVDHG